MALTIPKRNIVNTENPFFQETDYTFKDVEKPKTINLVIPGRKTMTTTPTVVDKNFFTPATEVRARDIVREIPGATKDIGKEIAQSIARSFVATSQGLFNIVNNQPGTAFIPQTDIQKKIFGNNPVNFESVGRETANIVGKGDDISKPTAVGLGMAMATLDIYPGSSGSKNAIKKTAQIISKTEDVSEITKVLKSVIKGKDKIIKGLADGLSKLDKADEIEKIITKIKITPKIKTVEKRPLKEIFSEPRIAETEAEAIAKRFSVPERKVMEDFIDVTRGVKKLPVEERKTVVESAQFLAERYKLDEAVESNTKLANKFDELLQAQRKEFKDLVEEIEIPKTTISDNIAKAKAEGKSFDEWVKGQGETFYHGTDRTFDDFDAFAEPSGKFFGTKAEEYGVWFTKSKQEANNIGENVIEVKLNIKNPRIIDNQDLFNMEGGRASEMSEALGSGNDALILKADNGQDWIWIPGEKMLKNGDIVDRNLSDIIKTKSQLKQLWDKTGKEEAFGAFAGVETDEQGKITGISPEKAALGVLGIKSSKVLNKASAKYGVKAKSQSFISKQKETLSNTLKAVSRGAGKLLTPISTRLNKISPELKNAARKLDFETGQNILKDTKKVIPLLKKTAKMSGEDQKIFDLARKNGDREVIEAIAEKYGIKKELQATREVLDDLFKRGNEVGMDTEYRGDYFPRVVKDTNGLMEYLHGVDGWSQIEEALKTKANKLGIAVSDMTVEDKARVINSMLRGYGDKITLSAPGFTKERGIEFLAQDLDKFYDTSDASLVKYINTMNDEIGARKFFGKELNNLPENLNASDSIGAYVMKLIESGKIKPSQEKEVVDILKARFNKGRMNEALQTYRNIEYLSTMGNPISAITQIGDLAWSLYDNGFYKTGKGILKSIFKKGITKEELGIERIAQEFTEPSKTAKLVERVFKLVGLDKIDRIGKEALINANWDKIQKQAKKGDIKLLEDMKIMFSDKASKVVNDIKAGKVNDDTKFILFQRLGDFQPITKAEMPEKYLSMPNGRIFYMLKSFTIKQIDVFRREAIDQIIKGTPKEKLVGFKNLIKLGGLFMLANATADEIKDFVLDRETDLSDRVIDNLLRAGGLSKFDVYQIRMEGLGSALIKKILFPLSVADALSKDFENITTNKKYKVGKLKGEKYKLETVQRVPVVGKIYYWWLGRGKQKQNYKSGSGTSRSSELDKIFKSGGTSRKSLNEIFK